MKKAIPILILSAIILLEGLTIYLLVNHYQKKLDEEYRRGYHLGAEIKREMIDNEIELNSIPAAEFISMLGAEFEREYESNIDSLTNDIIRLFVAWIEEQSTGKDYRVYTGNGEESGDPAVSRE